MDVHVHIERRPKTLNNRDGAATTVRDPLLDACTAPKPAEHAPHEDAGHGPGQPVIPREQIPDAVGHGQHPLANRDVRKDVIDQMRRAFRHPAAATRRTDRAAFARERDEAIQPARVEALGSRPEVFSICDGQAAESQEPKARSSGARSLEPEAWADLKVRLYFKISAFEPKPVRVPLLSRSSGRSEFAMAKPV